MLNIAHRGASGLAPEHTFAAYDLALASGADYLEHDVHMTRDGVLVVLHDATLDRTARGRSGFVADHTLAELRRCDVGTWFNEAHPERALPEYEGLRIPTLDEVFRRYSGARHYVELKDPELYPGMEEEMVRLLRARGLIEPAPAERRVLIQSFLPRSLERVHELDGRLPLIRLYPETAAGTIEEAARYAAGIGVAASDADEDLVARAHRLGLEVHVYTVNSSAEMLRLAGLRVDGIFTDFPGRLASIERQLARDADVVDRVSVVAPAGGLVERV